MAASDGTSRFVVTCALLRQYMRKHQGRHDLARLFQGSPAPALPPVHDVAPEDEDDRTMQLFPVRSSTLQSSSQQEIRPQVTEDDSKAAAMPIFCEVTHQNQAVLDETQMRAASLHRFLKKRKVRMSDAKNDHNDDSTKPAKMYKDAAACMAFLDMPDPSWLRL